MSDITTPIEVYRPSEIARQAKRCDKTLSRIGSPVARRGNSDEDVEQALHLLFHRLSDALPAQIVSALKASGIDASPLSIDVFTFLIWMKLAEIADNELARRGLDTMFDGGENSEVEYPVEIRNLCERISQ
ncbi:MAG TPA: hypothetical protein VGO67_23515 [Verrucomicrobiae bacterium]|jgi:hypothetical protein